jgi:hypothetical protein
MELPKHLSLDDWAAVGQELGKQQQRLRWYIGDWWNHPGHSYGERRALVESEDWSGPAYGTCANAGTTCEKFELSRRRESLSFSHHVEVADLPPNLADKLLDWCEETRATTGKPRPIRALRDEINRRVERHIPVPAHGDTESTKAIAVTVVPAPPREDTRAVFLPIPAIPRHEPEVEEQIGDGTSESSDDRLVREVVLAAIYDGLRKETISAALRDRLQECLRLLR